MNKQSLILHITLATLFLNTTFSFGQCVVCVDAPPLITCGETATLTGDGFLTSIYEDNFNIGIGALWTSVSTGGSTTSPCTGASTGTTINCAGAGAVPAGDFLWWGQGSAVPRQATTIPIPVPAGGDVIFEFKMEGQGGSCDGPDLIGEGTILQYRVGAGIWQDMPATMWPFNLNPMPYTNKAYFCPTNPALQSFTSWSQYSIPIPALAFSLNTQFRWRQISPTNQNWDFWGLDNVNISPSSAGGANYTWNPGGAGQSITVNPTSLTNYTFTYTNSGISCSTTVAVDVAPPVVNPVIVPNPLNPCPNVVDLSADASFNSCNYNIYLYDNGGDGWTTLPQTSTSIDNRIQVWIDGILANTITMNNGYGPVIYSFPVTAGGTFETVFLSGGPNPAECAYFIEDNLGNLIIDPTSLLAYPNNAISAMGLTTSPSSPWWPVPASVPPSPGFSITPNGFGPVSTVCPTVNQYDYSWSTSPGGTTAGIATPLSQSTAVTVLPNPQDYQVCIVDQLPTGCFACSTITVPGNPGIGTFDITPTTPFTICSNDPTPVINPTITSLSISIGLFTFDLEDGIGTVLLSSIPFDASTLPFTLPISGVLPTPLSSSSSPYTFTVNNIQDASGCNVPITNPTITIVVNDPPVVGAPPLSTIELCTSTLPTDTLPTSWLSAPDVNGTWTYLGLTPGGSNLPFIGYNYLLDPSIFPVGLNLFQYQVSTVAGCPTPSPSQVSINITGAPYAGVLPANGPDLCMNGSNIPFDLNSLFTSIPAPFSPLYWTDITNGAPGGGTNSNFTPSSPDIYTLRYTAPITGNCPADIEDIIIEVFAQPTALISTDDLNDAICEGETIHLQFNLAGQANFTVDYIDPITGGSQTVTLNAAGNDASTNLPIQIFPTIGSNLYTITNIEDGNVCSNTAQPNVVVTVVMQPNAGNATATTVCSDDFTMYSLNGLPFFTGGDVGGSWAYEGTIPPTPYPFGTFQAWNPVLNSAIDPFGTYQYTVSDPTGTCPPDWEDITIVDEMAPNTGNATNQDICVNDYGGLNPLYNLNNLLDGTQDVGGDWFYAGALIPTGTIDPNLPSYSIGANAFTYEIAPVAPSVCTNNGSLPYITQSILTIYPEPVVDPLTFINNPPNPISVPQGTSTTITVDMSVGTAPFTVSLSGNESPPPLGPGQSSGTFNILFGMSGSGLFTPNYDINTIPVSVSITSVMDGHGCWTYPTISTPVTVEPWPLIAASASSSVPCETDVVNLLLEGIQGAVPLNVYYTINGTAQPTALVGNLSAPLFSIPIDAQLSIGPNSIVITSIIDAMGNTCPPNLLPTTTAAINVLVNPNPIISSFTTPEDEICEGEDAILEFDFSVGTPPFNVSINASGILPLTTMTAQHTISPTLIATIPPYPGPYTYLVTNYLDSKGCIGINPTDAVGITVHPIPEIGINPFPNEICEGESIALNLIPVNTSILAIPPIYTVEYTANGFSPTSEDIDQNGVIVGGSGIGGPIIVSPSVTTTYKITNFHDPLTLCGSVSPDSTATLIVNENPLVEISNTPEVCAGNKSYITFIFTRGTSPWTINYNNNGFPVSLGPWSDTTTVDQILTSTTNYDFTRVTDYKSCYTDLFNNFDIAVNPIPIAELTVDNRFICDNENSKATLTFEVNSGALPYKIFYRVNLDNTQIPDSIGNMHTIDTNVTGDYKIIRVVDSKGCEAIEKGETVTIVVNPTPTAEFMVYPQPTDINSPFISFVNQSSGHISSIWTGYNLLDSNNNVTSYWSDTLNTNSTFIHEFEAIADTHYILLEVSSDSGCTARDSSFIIIDPSFTIFVPDAFTPDNDLHNDYFLPVVNGIQEYTLNIYDRLGNRIFETNDYISQDCARGCTKKKIEEAIYECIEGCNAAWDGKINNEFVPAGNFVYSIVLIDINGKTRNFNGSLTLIR